MIKTYAKMMEVLFVWILVADLSKNMENVTILMQLTLQVMLYVYKMTMVNGDGMPIMYGMGHV